MSDLLTWWHSIENLFICFLQISAPSYVELSVKVEEIFLLKQTLGSKKKTAEIFSGKWF